jgi:MYXO-CTERM domain-containing protein
MASQCAGSFRSCTVGCTCDRKVLALEPVVTGDKRKLIAVWRWGGWVVRKFWDRKQDAVERALRSERPIARDELVSALVERTAAARPERRWSRVAFASALTVFMLGFFASFGGLSYAATGAKSAARSVTTIVMPSKTHAVRTVQSAADNQYAPQKYTPPAATPKPKVIQVAGISTEQPPSTSSELPFTGFGLGMTAALGLSLVGLGVLLRRRESRVRE